MKRVTFEKMYRQTNNSLMMATVKQSGIILGHGPVMSIKEVDEWIKSAHEFIEEKKEDIRVAEACIKLFNEKFTLN